MHKNHGSYNINMITIWCWWEWWRSYLFVWFCRLAFQFSIYRKHAD